MIKMFSLWKHVGKNGKEYYSGRWGNDAKVIAFIREKKNEKEPDLDIMIDEWKDLSKPAIEAKPKEVEIKKDIWEQIEAMNKGDDSIPF